MASWDETERIDKIENLIKDKNNLKDAIRQLDIAYNWDEQKITFIKRPLPFLRGDVNIKFSDFSTEIRQKMIDSFRQALLAEKNRIEDEIIKLMNGDADGR